MRIAPFILGAAIAAMPLGCSRQDTGQGAGGKRISVLCSTFPMYLFTRAVTAGEANLSVDLMIPGGMGCPHDYALTPQDIRKIAGVDVLIANGLGMEEFLGATIRGANARIVVIDTSAGIDGLIELKGQGPGNDHHHAGPNPHLFASPRMAGRIVRNIAAELGRIDPAGEELYKKNAESFAAGLERLADDFVAALKDVPSRKIVTEHAVFDYLAKDCGLEIVAVVEEHPGQEPSASEMLKLARTIKASGAAAIFTEPQYPAKVGHTIAREVGVPVAVLDPVSTGPEGAGPDYYETTMRANLDRLVKTLKAK